MYYTNMEHCFLPKTCFISKVGIMCENLTQKMVARACLERYLSLHSLPFTFSMGSVPIETDVNLRCSLQGRGKKSFDGVRLQIPQSNFRQVS